MARPSGPGTSLVVHGAIRRADVPLLRERLGRLLADTSADLVTCEVSRLVVNLQAIDALAWLQLTARRHGRRITLVGGSPELDQLIANCGLADVFRQPRPPDLCPDSAPPAGPDPGQTGHPHTG